MSPASMLFLIISWSFVLGLAFWAFWAIFRAQKE